MRIKRIRRIRRTKKIIQKRVKRNSLRELMLNTVFSTSLLELQIPKFLKTISVGIKIGSVKLDLS
jgi:hypothetical protein